MVRRRVRLCTPAHHCAVPGRFLGEFTGHKKCLLKKPPPMMYKYMLLQRRILPPYHGMPAPHYAPFRVERMSLHDIAAEHDGDTGKMRTSSRRYLTFIAIVRWIARRH